MGDNWLSAVLILGEHLFTQYDTYTRLHRVVHARFVSKIISYAQLCSYNFVSLITHAVISFLRECVEQCGCPHSLRRCKQGAYGDVSKEPTEM